MSTETLATIAIAALFLSGVSLVVLILIGMGVSREADDNENRINRIWERIAAHRADITELASKVGFKRKDPDQTETWEKKP